MAVNEQGHYGKYSGNARCCMGHPHTRVDRYNYKPTERDDAAHISYLKRDIMYDAHHGHDDEKMVADEKHISKLAGDMKYDKKHHGAGKHHGPAKALVGKQDELPEHLQEKILDSPGKHCFGPSKYAHESPSKRYNIK
jgi:hypothetical protein|tara:strand:- start:23 stop:436 length:414 start_codon:yes stop_codon:yes gene_type:complete